LDEVFQDHLGIVDVAGFRLLFSLFFLVLIQEFMGLFDPAFMYFASMIVVQVVVLFHLVVESVHQ
jgi:hypothetical protein